MPTRRLFEKGSISEKIMALVYLNGELPYRALRITGVNSNSTRRTVKRLIEEGYLEEKTVLKRKRTLVLGKREPDEEPFFKARETYEIRKKSDLEFTGNTSRTSYNRRRRNMLIAETSVFMLEAGLQIFPDEKPLLGIEKIKEKAVCMYRPSEIKDVMTIDEKKACASRATALLVIHYEVSLVYYLYADKIHYGKNTEDLIKDRFERVINDNSEYRDRHNTRLLIKSTYLLTKNPLFLTSIIKNSNKNGKAAPFKIDDTFVEYYYIPITRNGIRMFQMICTEEYREQIYHLVMKTSERIARKEVPVVCDGMKEDGTLIYDYMVPEINKIRKFLMYIRNSEKTQISYVIYCYDFQLEELNDLFLSHDIENPNILAYSIDTVEQLFYKEK